MSLLFTFSFHIFCLLFESVCFLCFFLPLSLGQSLSRTRARTRNPHTRTHTLALSFSISHFSHQQSHGKYRFSLRRREAVYFLLFLWPSSSHASPPSSERQRRKLRVAAKHGRGWKCGRNMSKAPKPFSICETVSRIYVFRSAREAAKRTIFSADFHFLSLLHFARGHTFANDVNGDAAAEPIWGGRRSLRTTVHRIARRCGQEERDYGGPNSAPMSPQAASEKYTFQWSELSAAGALRHRPALLLYHHNCTMKYDTVSVCINRMAKLYRNISSRRQFFFLFIRFQWDAMSNVNRIVALNSEETRTAALFLIAGAIKLNCSASFKRRQCKMNVHCACIGNGGEKMP